MSRSSLLIPQMHSQIFPHVKSFCFPRWSAHSRGPAMAAPASNSSAKRSISGSDHLRHVESMSQFPSGAGKIPRLNAVVLGESLASEEDDLVFPSEEFCKQALISSPKQVILFSPFFFSIFFFWQKDPFFFIARLRGQLLRLLSWVNSPLKDFSFLTILLRPDKRLTFFTLLFWLEFIIQLGQCNCV